MAFFDDVVKTTQKAGKAVAQKATEVYDLTKINLDIAGLENKLDDAFVEIGKLVFDRETKGAEIDAPLAEAIAAAAELNEQLEAAKQSRRELKKQAVCPTCGKVTDADAAFCSACGAKIAGDTEE